MTEARPSTSPAYFQALYDADPDPWKFATSDYEALKYQATLDALPRPLFGRGLEVGCSIGVLTDRLAARVDSLLSVDVDPKTLARAQARNARHTHVRFARSVIPADWPEETFDLIVLSEVLYFLSPADVTRTGQLARQSLAPDGAVVLVNWTNPTNYPCGGDEAADLFIAASGLAGPCTRAPDYRLDVLSR